MAKNRRKHCPNNDRPIRIPQRTGRALNAGPAERFDVRKMTVMPMPNVQSIRPVVRPTPPILVAYFPVLDPHIPMQRLDDYARAGVDVVELGLKAGNPVLDGDTVARTMRRAHGEGRVGDAIAAARYLRQLPNRPFGVLFCYPEDPVLEADEEWADIDGVLCLATDPARRDLIVRKAVAHGARQIEFVPYRQTEADLARARQADGYVMLQYLAGKTGARSDLDACFAERLARLRSAGVTAPIVTGIGVSTTDQVRHAIEAGADGVVTGSEVIRLAETGTDALAAYLGQMREVLNGA